MKLLLSVGLIFTSWCTSFVIGQSDVFEDEVNNTTIQYLNVGVLMASNLGTGLFVFNSVEIEFERYFPPINVDSPFDLERCGPAVDLALEEVNEVFLKSHRIELKKVQGR